jgi:hypothetical protein
MMTSKQEHNDGRNPAEPSSPIGVVILLLIPFALLLIWGFLSK